MNLLMTILLLLVCLLISNVISHYMPAIPTALIQIGFGVLLALGFQDFTFPIETEWFLLLFVAPLLYNDGRHFPREELWELRAPIFGNAIILVLLTAIGGGYFIHWLIPAIPLTAAFALAAILSPTDPVAVNGIAKRIHIPERVLNLVRGESLINDASGLVAFNYAVAAVVTGYFSLREALTDFAYMFIAGAVLGLVLSLLVAWIRFNLRKQGIQDVTFHTLVQLLTPFAIFIITEELLHASGVIAVVVAGIVHGMVKERTATFVAEEQVLTENMWSIVLFVLNGFVFLLLGLNIPSSMIDTLQDPNMGNAMIIGFVIAIGVVILAIRFVWSLVFSYTEKPDLRTSLFVCLSGVRGAVTMAGVLSIPFLIASGDTFPARSLLLFLASGVILFTLLAATLLLPLLSRGQSADVELPNEEKMNEAKEKVLLAAIKKIRSEMNQINEAAAYELMDEYKLKFQQIKPERYTLELSDIRLKALKMERKYINGLMEQDGVDAESFAFFEKALDSREEALSNNARSRILFLVGRAMRGWRQLIGLHRKDRHARLAKLRVGRDIQLQAFRAALEYLEEFAVVHPQADLVNAVIVDYKQMIVRLSKPMIRYNEQTEEQKEELRLKVMDLERSEIHGMYESGEINREQARELRRFINHLESVTLYVHVE